MRGDFGWDYPPGVTGNEPQITGELGPCDECGEELNENDDLAELTKPCGTNPDGGQMSLHRLVHAEPCATELLKKGWRIA
jgi:hypothetical protein